MKRIATYIFCIILFAQSLWANNTIQIIRFSGDVKIRRGLDENWTKASKGDVLEEIDSIVTGEDGQVELRLSNGQLFQLGSNSLIDVSDLREITEKELFLYIMSNKVKKIKKSEPKTPLRIGSVSVVHGEQKDKPEEISDKTLSYDKLDKEKNGARAMYDQEYYTNTILKLHKIIAQHYSIDDCGEIYYYLGKSFELINKNGQAIDAYQTVINIQERQSCNNPDAKVWGHEAQQGIDRLSH